MRAECALGEGASKNHGTCIWNKWEKSKLTSTWIPGTKLQFQALLIFDLVDWTCSTMDSN